LTNNVKFQGLNPDTDSPRIEKILKKALLDWSVAAAQW
jgi:hypothetical protein